MASNRDLNELLIGARDAYKDILLDGFGDILTLGKSKEIRKQLVRSIVKNAGTTGKILDVSALSVKVISELFELRPNVSISSIVSNKAKKLSFESLLKMASNNAVFIDNITVKETSLPSLPVQSHYFDVAFIVSSLKGDATGRKDILKECRRALNVNGTLVILTNEYRKNIINSTKEGVLIKADSMKEGVNSFFTKGKAKLFASDGEKEVTQNNESASNDSEKCDSYKLVNDLSFLYELKAELFEAGFGELTYTSFIKNSVFLIEVKPVKAFK